MWESRDYNKNFNAELRGVGAHCLEWSSSLLSPSTLKKLLTFPRIIHTTATYKRWKFRTSQYLSLCCISVIEIKRYRRLTDLHTKIFGYSKADSHGITNLLESLNSQVGSLVAQMNARKPLPSCTSYSSDAYKIRMTRIA